MKPQAYLSDLKKGEKAIVQGFSTEDVPTKLLEMGLLPGAELEFVCSAPFKGPICVCFTDGRSCLALRQNEASCILIEKK